MRRRHAHRGALALLMLIMGPLGCGGGAELGTTLRFQNAEPVWKVNDRLDIPEKPSERPFNRYQYYLDAYLIHWCGLGWVVMRS